jgi:hypothetical protein
MKTPILGFARYISRPWSLQSAHFLGLVGGGGRLILWEMTETLYLDLKGLNTSNNIMNKPIIKSFCECQVLTMLVNARRNQRCPETSKV